MARKSDLRPWSAKPFGGLPTELSWKIFVDRYTRKDLQRAFQVGDLAVVPTREDPKWPQKELAEVLAVEGDRLRVRLLTGESRGEELERSRLSCDRPLETTLEEVAGRIGRGIAQVEPDEERRQRWAREFAEEIAALRIIPGGRVWAGAGTGLDLTLYNCYVIPSPRDSRQGIVETLGQMIEIMSRGGGVGINVSSLRPFRAPVRSVNGRSSGAVSWMELYSMATGLIEQGGSRRGALMLQLDIRHPDWKRFVDIKKQPGRVENANISFRVTDDFMQAVKEDREWEFWFPDTSTPGYDEIWRGDFDDWEARGLPKIVYERRPAREVWREIIHAAWESAEPGVVFSTRHEKESNSWYFNRLVCTNPCVTGETLISTDRGLIPAVDLFREGGENVVVVDRRFGAKPRALASPVWMSGVKPVYRLRTKEGFELRLTADHRVMTERGWVEARHLQPGDRIYVQERTGGFGRTGSYDLGLVLGWLVGDGTLKEDRAVLSFFGEEKAELAPLFAQAVNRVVRSSTNGRNYAVGVVTATEVEDRVSSSRLRELAAEHGLLEEKLRVPESVFRGSREMQLGFLRALFSADGHVETGEKSRSAVVLSSKSAELLRGVQLLLLHFGIYSRIYRERRPAGWQSLPDGHGGRARYWRQELSDLRIMGASLVRFQQEVGFLQSRKRERLQAIVDSYSRGPYREEFVATFQELVPDGEEPVYDLNVAEVHAFAANGLVVHNCAEQPLPAWGVCTLGHVNLARMVDDSGRDVDWEKLGRSVRTLVRFLDDVVDATPYFMEENRQNQMRERRVGAGTMGLGELLIRLGLRYGSPEAVEFTERLYRFIALEAYRASVELAKEKGPFPAFEAEKFLESGFMRRMPEEIREAVRRHGIRNVTLLTQAPTGTVGTMVDTSTGIEPFYALKFTRRSRLGEDVQYVRVAEEWMEAHPGEELPPYFVGAMDLTPEEHVRMQAAVQKWTDSSISKTANAPADYTEEQVAELYMFAYDLGCKGVTVYRDQSRQEQVLAARHEEDRRVAEAARVPAAAADRAAVGPAAAGREREPRLRPEARPEVLTGRTTRIRTPLGNLYVTVNELNGRPFELFTQIGKAGSDVSALTEALARLISLALRSGVDPDAVAEQLIGIGGSQSVGFGPYRIRSVPDALGRILAGTWPDGQGGAAGTAEEEQAATEAPGERRADPPAAEPAGSPAGRERSRRPRSPKDIDLCPVCGAIAVHQDGCVKCLECGFSSC
ncbi:MAG: ribonucleoside-diphosphate reductase [Clostridia bacterium]|nr:ribonucleoside-diphosphate reductase [Clostridia bacterium]